MQFPWADRLVMPPRVTHATSFWHEEVEQVGRLTKEKPHRQNSCSAMLTAEEAHSFSALQHQECNTEPCLHARTMDPPEACPHLHSQTLQELVELAKMSPRIAVLRPKLKQLAYTRTGLPSRLNKNKQARRSCILRSGCSGTPFGACHEGRCFGALERMKERPKKEAEKATCFVALYKLVSPVSIPYKPP